MPKTSKALLLFTETYPAGQGESFVAMELPYLAARFSHVCIAPLWDGGAVTREVPDGVSVRPPLISARWRRLAVARGGLLSTAPLGPLLRDLPRALRTPTASTLTRYAYTALLVRGLLSRSDIRALLSPAGGFDLAYFYWGRGAAWALPFLGETIPTVARFHGSDLYEHLWDGYLPFRPALVERLDHLVFISEHGRSYMRERYPACAPRCQLHRLGVPDHGLGPEPDGEPYQLLSCSFAAPVKRLHLIAEALRHVDFPVEWTHLGGGPELDRVRALCAALPPHVRVSLPGTMPHAAVIEHLRTRAADLFLNVSASEGVPVSIMEALSFGVPVLATDVGGTSELTQPPGGLLLSPDVSPRQLAMEIAKTRDRDRHAARTAARDTWARLASADHNFSAFADFLLEAAG
jgi:glycosyltransferase involved in cell wall biosynthesis